MPEQKAQEASIPAVVITPRRPYLVWADSLPEGKKKNGDDEPLESGATWLMGNRPAKEGEQRVVSEEYKKWFVGMLHRACADRSLWPPLDYNVFMEWFAVSFGDEPLDLSAGIRLRAP